MTSTKRALVCAPLMPEFDRESGSRRIYHLIEFLREAGWHVTFIAQNPNGEQRYVRDLQQKGVAVYGGSPGQMEDLIRVGRFDLAILAFWYLAEAYIPILRRISPATRIVVDTIDLHFMRNARRAFRADRGHARGRVDSVFADETVRELNVYAAADAVWTVSTKEASLIADLVNDPHLSQCVPDAERLDNSTVPVAKRRGILFLGNFRHPPNLEGLEFLCRHVLPRLDENLLRRHPLVVVGNALDDRVRRIVGAGAGVQLVGWVPSVRPYLEQARLTVIPVLHGAGTKRKLVQALMSGTPAVSTSIGAEGLGLRHGQHVLIADDPASFAAEVRRLLSQTRLWTQLARAARRHVTAHHGWHAARAQFDRAVALVLSRPVAEAGGADIVAHPSQFYRQLVGQVREAIHTCVPAEATVLVVTRGDEELVKLNARRGWHFPQTEAGRYAGEYPANAALAIDHLETLASRGAEYLVFPKTAFWWLDYYEAFKNYLESCHSTVLRAESCIIFSLRSRPLEARPRGAKPPTDAPGERGAKPLVRASSSSWNT